MCITSVQAAVVKSDTNDVSTQTPTDLKKSAIATPSSIASTLLMLFAFFPFLLFFLLSTSTLEGVAARAKIAR